MDYVFSGLSMWNYKTKAYEVVGNLEAESDLERFLPQTPTHLGVYEFHVSQGKIQVEAFYAVVGMMTKAYEKQLNKDDRISGES